MWRLRKRNPGKHKVTRLELQRALMVECGTNDKTIRVNTCALKRLGWINLQRGVTVIITDKDLTGDY